MKYYRDEINDPNLTKKWWDVEPDEIYKNVWAAANFIRQNHGNRHKINAISRQLYENDYWKNNVIASRVLDEMSDRLNKQLSFNVIKSCIDTARSKIAKNKPRPLFVTDNADWFLKQKAKRLNKFILGLYDSIGSKNGLVRESLYTIGSEVFFDAALTGTGCAKMTIDIQNKRLNCERFVSDELLVDGFEGMYRQPRSIHHLKFIDREVVRARYPEKKYQDIIAKVTSERTGPTSDMIPVIESFHLPSGPNAKDGIRAVTTKTGTLHHAAWEKPFFPILVQRWNLRPLGYFGISLTEELYTLQCEISRTLRSIQLGLRRIAVPRLFRHIADHNAPKMKNIIGETHYYYERPPIFSTPTAFSMETYNYLEFLYQKAFELTGISQLSAQAQKPSGLNSGVALRNFQDIESERFSDVHLMYERFFTPQAAYMALELLDNLLEAGIDITVQAKDGVTLQPIKYSDVKIDKDSFTIQSYPTAFLPSEPAGRFAKIQELVNAGIYTSDEARELLDFPDLSKVNRIKSAPRSACIGYIEKVIDTGKYMPVEPYQDLALTETMVQAYYLDGRVNGMPQDRLDLLRRILTEVKSIREQINAKQLQAQQTQLQLLQGSQSAAVPQPEAIPESA